MIGEVMKKIYHIVRSKIFNKGELDFKSRKFNMGKFILTCMIAVLSGLVLYEGYLVNKLALKYRNLDFAYKKALKDIEGLEQEEHVIMQDCSVLLNKMLHKYSAIDSCLKKHNEQ